jgi:FecR protein
VSITHADKTVTQAAKNDALNAGDTIETKDGRLQLALIDGGKVSLQPNTIYKINKYEFSGKEDGTEYGFTELIKGGLRTISGLIGHKNRERYQLKTAVATIGIRGTEFTVNFNDNNLLMTTNHGSVDVCNEGGCLNAMTGQSVEVAGVGAKPKPSDKKAKAAAAAPVGKSTFTAGDPVTDIGIPNIIGQATPALTSGPGTIVAFSAESCGCTEINEIFTGDIQYDANKAVASVTGSGGNPSISPLSFSSYANDGIVAWGQADSGNYTSNGVNFALAKFDYIAGVTPNPANLANLTGTYNVFASTAPFLVTGNGITTYQPNTTTGQFAFNFSRNTFTVGLIVSAAGESFVLAGGGNLNANNPNFSVNNGQSTITQLAGNVLCQTGCSPALQANRLIQGAFFGASGERVGLQYGFAVPGLGGDIYGGAVLK